MRWFSGIFFLLLFSSACRNRDGKDWAFYGGNNAGNRYSELTQIDSANVGGLAVAWSYNAADTMSAGQRAREIECQPIVVHGILYGTSPTLKLFALDAASGRKLWQFDPAAKAQGYNSMNRGVNFWEDGDDRRIFYSAGDHLFCVDARTGKPVMTFGDSGKVDLHEGLESPFHETKALAVTATSPGIIYRDVFVTGSTVSESGDALPGDIRGFDVHTGRLRWSFHTIPRPGEPGYDTWPKDAWKKYGGANCWSGLVLDEKRGMVYLGTGAPSVDFYGGDRHGMNLYADCVIALDALTGNMKWYYQTIHHDLWDNDLPCPPNLVTVMHNGKRTDAVAQTTKDGLVYVLDRDSGTSLFPVEERAVDTAGLPGEGAWRTQKFPLLPAPFTRQAITDADLPDSTLFPDSYRFAKARFAELAHGKKFIPPSIGGSIYIGISGGAEWGGNATDPAGVLYQNASEVPWQLRMTDLATSIRESTSRGNTLYLGNCSACHGVDRKGNGAFPNLTAVSSKYKPDDLLQIMASGRGRMPSFASVPEFQRLMIAEYLLHPEAKEAKGTMEKDEHSEKDLVKEKAADFPYVSPYVRGRGGKFRDSAGFPAIRPPWGTLNAIDLNTGEYKWRVPLGEYASLTAKGIPVTGTENSGGPLVTAAGLLFIAGTEDEKIRAFDTRTGKVIWSYQLPGGAFATPITYMVRGKQYVVIAAGGVRNGHRPGGQYIAFALP